MTVWALTGLAAVGLAAALGVALGAVVAVRHRAALGADSASLAGAAAVVHGASAACAQAGAAAAAAGVRLIHCGVDGPVVTVTVTVDSTGWLRWAAAPEVIARAGPSDADTDEPGRIDYAS